jgi:hypothetical protein
MLLKAGRRLGVLYAREYKLLRRLAVDPRKSCPSEAKQQLGKR